jgi:hypothetical protein
VNAGGVKVSLGSFGFTFDEKFPVGKKREVSCGAEIRVELGEDLGVDAGGARGVTGPSLRSPLGLNNGARDRTAQKTFELCVPNVILSDERCVSFLAHHCILFDFSHEVVVGDELTGEVDFGKRRKAGRKRRMRREG